MLQTNCIGQWHWAGRGAGPRARPALRNCVPTFTEAALEADLRRPAFLPAKLACKWNWELVRARQGWQGRALHAKVRPFTLRQGWLNCAPWNRSTLPLC